MSRFDQIRESIANELAPYPGRTSGTLQDTLSMVLALVLVDTLRVPGIGLALALILLLQRESPGMTFRNILQVFGGSVVAGATCLFWVQVTDGTEVFRFLGFILGVFLASFCMAATRLPLFFTMFAFYGFVDLSGWDTHHSSNAVVTTTLYNIASLGLALGMAGIVNFLFGSRHPAEDLHNELTKRIRLQANFHRELASSSRKANMTELHHKIVQFAHAGDTKLNRLYEELRGTPGGAPAGIRFRIGLLSRVLERSSLLGFENSSDRDAHEQIASLCDHILNPDLPKPAAPGWHTSPTLLEIFSELSRYKEASEHADTMSEEARVQPVNYSLFHSDAFTTPDAALYALKLTLSATICYILYNAVAWPGILTCVVTVLFTGLSTTGAMKQKQLYRLSGAAIGGALAIAVESLLFPNMDSITSLILVMGIVCGIAAWISRSPRMGYVGVQIAFAFFITDLATFGAASQIAPARDRIIGISLGILVMWFVFDQIWPTRASHALEVIRNRMVRNANNLSFKSTPSSLASMRAEVSADLARMQMLVNSAWFDFSADQHRELARSRRLARQTEAAAAKFYGNLYRLKQAISKNSKSNLDGKPHYAGEQ